VPVGQDEHEPLPVGVPMANSPHLKVNDILYVPPPALALPGVVFTHCLHVLPTGTQFV